MNLLDKLLEELREKNDGELDLENNHYYLFLEDGVFDIFFDDDEGELKTEITFSDGVKALQSDLNIEKLMKEAKNK